MREWRGGGGWADKSPVDPRCRGPSVLLIQPICLRQTDFKREMSFKCDPDFAHVQRAGGGGGGGWGGRGGQAVGLFQPGSHETELSRSELRPRLFLDHGLIDSFDAFVSTF